MSKQQDQQELAAANTFRGSGKIIFEWVRGNYFTVAV